ncbi:hypothetical protein [Methanobrevibacter sp.]|uniref:hypothetical protein n=1 Tax=Methanobrevibacter sp. TaxID=66852 RepID=UPI003868F0C4
MKILYLTDLYYEAKGRKYFEEDLYVTDILKEHFDIALCHPKNSKDFENDVDLIVFRNTGPVSGFEEEYESFVKRVTSNNIRTFNEFVGKADMKGKQYLLDLTLEDYPVIPTIDDLENINLLPDCERYVIKPKDGADSIGLEFLTKSELFEKDLVNMLIQPAIDFEYEVSFYFINDSLEYALYAPDKDKRWELEKYEFSQDDKEFAEKFIAWNDIENGIQRVDACRTKEGELLLVELEDLNPYLSILELDEKTRDDFMNHLTIALKNICD